MTADSALAEDDEAARENVGALDRDRHGQLHVCRAEKVRGAHAYALAAGDIHSIDGNLPPALGQDGKTPVRGVDVEPGLVLAADLCEPGKEVRDPAVGRPRDSEWTGIAGRCRLCSLP